jgi:pentatricopeptide repeat protein
MLSFYDLSASATDPSLSFDRIQALHIDAILPKLVVAGRWSDCLRLVAELEHAAAELSSRGTQTHVSRAVYDLAMRACDQSFRPQECVGLFNSLVAQGLTPDKAVYTKLLRSVCRMRDWRMAIEVLDRLEQVDHHVSLDLDTWKAIQAVMPSESDSTQLARHTTYGVIDLVRELRDAQKVLQGWLQDAPSTDSTSSASAASTVSFDLDLDLASLSSGASTDSPDLSSPYSDESTPLSAILQSVLPPPGVPIRLALQQQIEATLRQQVEARSVIGTASG